MPTPTRRSSSSSSNSRLPSPEGESDRPGSVDSSAAAALVETRPSAGGPRSVLAIARYQTNRLILRLFDNEGIGYAIAKISYRPSKRAACRRMPACCKLTVRQPMPLQGLTSATVSIARIERVRLQTLAEFDTRSGRRRSPVDRRTGYPLWRQN